MQLPKKQRHAIEAVLKIACTRGVHAVSSKDLADAQGVKSRYLEQLLQRLVKAGILRSVRGPRGGYVLAREKRRISLADIVLAMDTEPVESAESELGRKVLDPVWMEIKEIGLARLASIDLAELSSRVNALSLQSNKVQRADFVI